MRSRMKSTLSNREVHAYVESWLEPLGLRDHGPKCTKSVLFNLLIIAAARMCSLFAACRDLKSGPSDQAVRNALEAMIPHEELELQRRLNQALWFAIPRKWIKKRPWKVAIDLTLIPYHGHPGPDPQTLVHSVPKSGTTKFHAYATVYVTHYGQRYTLGLLRVFGGQRMEEVVRKLLQMVRRKGLKIKLLLLDKAFFNVPVIRYLKRARVPFIMPVVIRGRKPKPGKPTTGLRSFLRKPHGWYEHTQRGTDGRRERVHLCVASKVYKHRKSGKKRVKKLLFACWGWRGNPKLTRETYRKRFGIESSYRQMNQGRIRTCTTDPQMRFLFVGIALILRNVWVWLHLTILADFPNWADSIRLTLLRFRQMLHWLELFARTILPPNSICTIQRFT